MKKLLNVIILTIVFYNSGQAAREITIFDIARWYLDADLVMICNVNRTDTFSIVKYDSLLADGFHLRFDILREKYHISIDSIIKSEQNLDGMTDTIFTPEFTSSARREKIEFNGFDSNGDSTFLYTAELFSDFDDDGYFRIKSPEKRLVILRKNEIGYVIDYQTVCDSTILNLIQEVEIRGEDFFNWMGAHPIKSENLMIYPNPFTDEINIKGVGANRIEITDMYGRINKMTIKDPNHIDLSYLKPGAYVISVITANNKWTQKIVKE